MNKIDKVYQNIIESLCHYQLSMDNTQALNYIKTSLHNSRKEITSFYEIEKHTINTIDKIIPILKDNDINKVLLRSIKARIPLYTEESANNSSEKKRFSNFLQIIKRKVLPFTKTQLTTDEDSMQQRAIEVFQKIKNEFSFKDIIVTGPIDWSAMYSMAHDAYRAIQEAQENMTLGKKTTAEDNLTLNLQQNGNLYSRGFMHGSYMPHSQIISLYCQNSIEQMRVTWQHEYTHYLDYSICRLYETFVPGTAISANIMRQLFTARKTNFLDEAKKDKVLRYTCDLLASLYASESAAQYAQLSYERVENILTNFYIRCIDNLFFLYEPIEGKRWHELSSEDKSHILRQPEFIQLQSIIADIVFKVNIDTPENADILKKIMSTVMRNKIGENRVTSQTFIKIVESLIPHNLLNLSRNGLFIQSKAALNAELLNRASPELYWSQPQEMLARASEEIQRPLTMESVVESPGSRIYLNRSERELVLLTIRSMAQKLGLDVLPHYIEASCLAPDSQYNPDNTKGGISLATDNERQTKILIKINEIRDRKSSHENNASSIATYNECQTKALINIHQIRERKGNYPFAP